MNLRYEEEIIRLFVRKDRKERYLFMLARPDRRDEIVGALHGQIEFDPRFCTALPHALDPKYLCGIMKEKGAGEYAYVMSNIEDMDGRVLPLLDALQNTVDATIGTIVYCFEGQVAYYESDDAGCCLLHKGQ